MAELSGKKFIARNRPPRVQIEYGVEIGHAEKMVQLPFVMGVMADLSGKPDEPLPRLRDRRFLEIDRENFNAVMNGMKPRLAFRVDNKLTDYDIQLAVELRFQSMDDFHPEAVVGQVEPLRRLLEIRRMLSGLLTKMDGNHRLRERLQEIVSNTELLRQMSEEAVLEKAGLLDQTISECRIGRDEEQREQSHRQIATLVEEVMQGTVRVAKDIEAMVNTRIADIDGLLSRQLNEIMHALEFQKLEGAWRGLKYLVYQTETDTMLKLRVINVSKEDLLRDLERAAEFDQSALFKKVYEEEYGIFGGHPFGMLVGDYEFGRHPQDLALLEKLSYVAAAAHTPFIANAGPHLFNLDSFTQLSLPRDLAKIFDTVEYAKWKSLRDADDSRYIFLAMPRFLARLPYGAKTDPVREFAFEEDTDGGNHEHYCWANSSYAMAVNINRAFKLYGWCSRICGIESGGGIERLLVHTFLTDDGGVDTKGPTEIAINDRRAAELAELGFMPILHRKNSEMAAFIGAGSLHKPARLAEDDARANAYLAAQLPYLFAVCRFAHYLKSITRDKSGEFREPVDLEMWLNKWINNYVEPNLEMATEVARARRPLQAAEVVVENPPYRVGVYSCKLYLLPYYQLGALKASLRMGISLPSAVRG